ncbi:PIR protein CIR protein [Plasmodium vinckei brucechwatti]|uniref:PIR protein CIR protein n=1 Tax=Plasmodium vinckei brucechwatti TaxID=119398 RepID=A0A6V7RTZ2_PLAVN|nr:PIR protein CIR protein [Plasmodium vinckei brucechwatti]
MEPKDLCKLFLDADKIINDEHYNNMTLEQIINDPKFKEYCPNSNCETNLKINGFGEYLFNQLGTQIENEYYEYFMMWLSDKLFEIAKDDNNPQINDITLNEAYDKYLKKNIKNGSYWVLLDIKKGLKEVNLKYMEQFYKLLNNICKAIVYYKPNDDDTAKFISNSTECYNQYLSLYTSVSNCDSYLHLLDNLKKTYEDFKNSVHEEIKNNYPYLEGRLKTLKIENTDSYFVNNFKEFDFSDENCKPKTKKTGELSHRNGSEDSKNKSKDSENSEGNTGDTPGNKGISNSENGSSDDGSGESETQSTSWLFFGIGSYISTIASKGKEQLNNAVTSLETIKKKVTETTNTIQNLYSRSVSNIQAAYEISRNLLYGAIGNISSYYKQLGNIFIQKYDHSGSDETKDKLPKSNDPSQSPKYSPQTQKESSQTSSKIPHTSLPSSSNGQIKTPQSSQDPSGNKIFDQTDQGGPQKPVSVPVPKQENSGTNVKGNETTGIGDIYALKKYKQIGISIIFILIPITLAIMYKYLSFGRRKELKGKKNMKKVINSIGGKRPIQIIIKSYDRKKDLKPIINSVGRKKYPLLNIYKLMQADPIPFINLFFLLIFFVYKRKYDFLEL